MLDQSKILQVSQSHQGKFEQSYRSHQGCWNTALLHTALPSSFSSGHRGPWLRCCSSGLLRGLYLYLFSLCQRSPWIIPPFAERTQVCTAMWHRAPCFPCLLFLVYFALLSPSMIPTSCPFSEAGLLTHMFHWSYQNRIWHWADIIGLFSERMQQTRHQDTENRECRQLHCHILQNGKTVFLNMPPTWLVGVQALSDRPGLECLVHVISLGFSFLFGKLGLKLWPLFHGTIMVIKCNWTWNALSTVIGTQSFLTR